MYRLRTNEGSFTAELLEGNILPVYMNFNSVPYICHLVLIDFVISLGGGIWIVNLNNFSIKNLV